MRVLYIEDSRKLRDIVSASLRNLGYTVETSGNGSDGKFQIENNEYDIIILDLMLPGMDGLSLLSRMRSSDNLTPVLILSAKDAIADRVKGLEMGADDYLIKPFALDELIARVSVLSRRATNGNSSKMKVRDLEIDTAAKTVTRAGTEIPLSAREYDVLEILMRRAGTVVSRTTLDTYFYEDSEIPMSNVIDVIVCSIRRKITMGRKLPNLITTRRGIGYTIPLDS